MIKHIADQSNLDEATKQAMIAKILGSNTKAIASDDSDALKKDLELQNQLDKVIADMTKAQEQNKQKLEATIEATLAKNRKEADAVQKQRLEEEKKIIHTLLRPSKSVQPVTAKPHVESD